MWSIVTENRKIVSNDKADIPRASFAFNVLRRSKRTTTTRSAAMIDREPCVFFLLPMGGVPLCFPFSFINHTPHGHLPWTYFRHEQLSSRQSLKITSGVPRRVMGIFERVTERWKVWRWLKPISSHLHACTNTLLKSRQSSISPNFLASCGYGTLWIKGRNAFCECRSLYRCNMRVIQIYCKDGVRQTQSRRGDSRSDIIFQAWSPNNHISCSFSL